MKRLLLMCVTLFLTTPWNSSLMAQHAAPLRAPSEMPLQNANPRSGVDSVRVDWVRNYDSGYDPAFDIAYAIAVDASENVYVAGASYGENELTDFTTIKYDSTGNALWIQRYNNPENGWDAAHAMEVDASGNVYVTGVTHRTSTDFDIITVKYNPSGVQQWLMRYNGPANGDDWANDIFVDGPGNVYVTGYSPGAGTFYDYVTIKYNGSGVQQWVARYNAPGNTKDQASALAVDASGNVYVTGSSGEFTPNLSDFVTIKYNSSGVQQWEARYDNLFDYATELVIDASANVYVSGYSYGSSTFYDFATIKYNSEGVQQWVDRYTGTGISDDFPYDIGIDPTGNIYVTGESVGAGTSADVTTIKYTPSGSREWVARYNGPGNAVDRGVALAFDPSGNIYVTGDSDESEDDFATIKYDPSGVQRWVARYNGTGDTYDLAYDVAVSPAGNVCVTGYSARVGRRLFTTIRYVPVPLSIPCEDIGSFKSRCRPGGLIQARVRFTDGSHAGEVIEFSIDGSPYEVIVGEDGVGLLSESGFNPGSHTVELTNPPLCFDPIVVNCPTEFSTQGDDLWDFEEPEKKPVGTTTVENYPNPFNPTTTIRFSLSSAADVTLRIFNVLGEEIASLVSGYREAGVHMVQWDASGRPSGIYFYRLQAGEFTETRKLMLLR